MYRYPDSQIYVPATEDLYCPKCGSRSLKDNGGCKEGCCDDYVCNDCELHFRIEWPD